MSIKINPSNPSVRCVTLDNDHKIISEGVDAKDAISKAKDLGHSIDSFSVFVLPPGKFNSYHQKPYAFSITWCCGVCGAKLEKGSGKVICDNCQELEDNSQFSKE